MLVKGETNISYICSQFYRAPAFLFSATEYATSTDIWSTDCVLAELLLSLVYICFFFGYYNVAFTANHANNL
ncbi:uncharacterized protein DS421_17g586330 [Arachis hypogaea]|nr:uncharacterized protein DS421_17g586330 [Arachis hypogaea]